MCSRVVTRGSGESGRASPVLPWRFVEELTVHGVECAAGAVRAKTGSPNGAGRITAGVAASRIGR